MGCDGFSRGSLAGRGPAVELAFRIAGASRCSGLVTTSAQDDFGAWRGRVGGRSILAVDGYGVIRILDFGAKLSWNASWRTLRKWPVIPRVTGRRCDERLTKRYLK